MEPDKSILLTAEGVNGKVELMETSVRITKYKNDYFGRAGGKWDKSKVGKVITVPRDKVDINKVNIVGEVNALANRELYGAI